MNPTIAMGKQKIGEILTIVGPELIIFIKLPIIDNEMKERPPPVGIGILWDDLKFGLSRRYLPNNGTILNNKKLDKKKEIKKIKIFLKIIFIKRKWTVWSFQKLVYFFKTFHINCRS